MINNLNQYIDQTVLKADARIQEIATLITEAKNYKFKAVCVNPYYVKYCAERLKNTKVKVCTVIGFPLGANVTAAKVFETKTAIANGANEIDIVINIGALKDQKNNYVLEELKTIRQVCKNIILKVIIETALLTEQEKITACKLISEAQADFIKTSTGFVANGGATVADVKLLKQHIAKTIAIKASGGIRTQEQALALINAGATRIGTSNGINIITNQSKNSNSY